MIRELEGFIWVALVVSATGSMFVYNRMVSRLRAIHPFVRFNEYWQVRFAPNYRLYRLTFGEDHQAMRLWYWAISLNCLTLFLLVLAGIITD
jgi:hypothetical protein